MEAAVRKSLQYLVQLLILAGIAFATAAILAPLANAQRFEPRSGQVAPPPAAPSLAPPPHPG